MLKFTIAAAILATATSFAVAQTGDTATTPAGTTEGASQSNVAPHAAKSTKSAKSKKMSKSTKADATSGSVTGATGTTSAGTPGMTTSGATKPASDSSASH